MQVPFVKFLGRLNQNRRLERDSCLHLGDIVRESVFTLLVGWWLRFPVCSHPEFQILALFSPVRNYLPLGPCKANGTAGPRSSFWS